MIIIGCPVKNDLKCMQLMINSLFNSTQCFDKLVFADGDSTDGTKEYLTYLSKVEPKIQLINLNSKTPLEAYNYLFELALNYEADLLLTQTDVIFPKLYNRDWLDEMQQIAKKESVGAVTCYNGGGVSGVDYIDGFRWLGGWCSYYPFRTIRYIGGYDKNFAGGYGVDIDHTYRIVNAKLQIITINYFVDHHMANSREHDRNPNTEQMKKEAGIYFKKKWNLL